jgi:LysM repeat protein
VHDTGKVVTAALAAAAMAIVGTSSAIALPMAAPSGATAAPQVVVAVAGKSPLPAAVLVETAPVSPKKHPVVAGESLSQIARAEGLSSWRPLWDVNRQVTNPDLIRPGWTLTVPVGATTARPLPAIPVALAKPVPAKRLAVHRSKATPPKKRVATSHRAHSAGGGWAAVAQCESGGNYATNTGNGYYGAYQFDLRTWRSVGGSGNPAAASPAEQDKRAQILYSQRGASPWPVCGRHLR